MRGKSDISGQKPGRDCMIQTLLWGYIPQNGKSVTAGSPLINKKTISNGSQPLCPADVPNTKSLQTSEAGLTSDGKVFFPYWNPFAAEMSPKLWLPTEIDCAGSDLSLSDGSLNITAGNSWFSITSLSPLSPGLSLTCLQLLLCSHAECTDSENTGLKSKKIRLYPNDEQKSLLRQWLGTARYIYNQTVAYLKQPDRLADWFGIKTELIAGLPAWAKSVPYQIKSVAVRDACIAVKNAKMKCKKTGQIQKVKFKSKKEQRDSAFVPKSAVKESSFYTTLLGKMMRTAEALPEALYDCRLTCENGKFWLCIPVRKTNLVPENQRYGAVALDPGVRTFQTFYSPVMAGKLGAGDFGRVQRLCQHLDTLYSKIGKAKCKRKRRLKKAAVRIREKIKNLINEIHHKAAFFLCKNFSVIFLPPFETSQMVSKLRSKTARAMLTWAHYRFAEFLKHKASEFGTRVVSVCEAYTSKTCSACGKIHNIGSKKVMNCTACGTIIDRDLNGARGIFLRALGDTPSFS